VDLTDREINNWTQLPGDGMTINTSSTQIEFVGTVATTNQSSYMQILMPGDYIITFDWSFSPYSERAYNPFGYYTDALLVYLIDRDDIPSVIPSSGSVSLYLTKNTLFKYFKWTDKILVTGSTATISNFKYQQMGPLSFTNNFIGEFAQGNWTINNTDVGTSVSIDLTTITMDSYDGPASDGTISITPTFDRIITFDWLCTGESTVYDYFGLYLNGSPIWLSNMDIDIYLVPSSPLSGSVGIYVPAGMELKFLKHGDTSTTSQSTVTNFRFAPLSPIVPCFALSNIIKYKLPSDANIIYKNQSNNYWIDINGLYLTRDHIVKINDQLLIAENVSNNIINEEDDVVDIQTSDGRFIVINDVEVATSK